MLPHFPCLLIDFIQIAMHHYQDDRLHGDISAVREVNMEMLEILGVGRERVIFVTRQVGIQNTCVQGWVLWLSLFMQAFVH